MIPHIQLVVDNNNNQLAISHQQNKTPSVYLCFGYYELFGLQMQIAALFQLYNWTQYQAATKTFMVPMNAKDHFRRDSLKRD